MKRIALVGVGLMGRPYLLAARKQGFAVHVVEAESWSDALQDQVDVHRIPALGADGWSVDEMWALGGYAMARDGGIDGILAFTEPQVLAAALVADRLGLPGPSLHASVLSRNKALQRACFAAHDQPQPEFTVVADHDRAISWATPRLPVVVKPLSSFGSAGVEQVSDADTLREVLTRRKPEKLLLEKAVDGPEFSWEGFVRDGEILFGNITAKETTGPPRFVEIAHRSGHRFDERTEGAVRRLTEDVVRCAGIRTGMVHLEFRVTAQGPVIMEVAVRTPGDFILDLVAATYAFDPYAATMQLALGVPPELPDSAEPKSYAAAWFPICPPGTVTAITGFETLLTHPLVSRAGMYVRVGDVVEPLHSSFQRAGYVLIKAPSPEKREEALATVREALRITTEPADDRAPR